jgi:hypothetical protein
MDAHQAAVPAIAGIDLAFRPRSYFGPIPAETHLLAHVTGHERREFVRRHLASDKDDSTLDLLAELFASDRETLGRVHPALMGGEYLPPFLDNETEIARISLASTTADQISVRAQRLADGIAYRIVDEYGAIVDYVCQPARSELPLTLGELIALIEGAARDGGAALSYLYGNIAADPSDPWRLRNFVSVSSEFYAELASYYDQRIAAWFEENYPVIDDDREEARDGVASEPERHDPRSE